MPSFACLGLALASAVVAQTPTPAATPASEAAVTAKPSAAPEDGRPRLFVSDLVAQGSSPEQAAALTDSVVTALSARALFRVVSSKELRDLLGVERQRQLLGSCAEGSGACAGNLGEASNARFVLTGALSRVGSAFQLTLQMLDTSRGEPAGRSARLAGDLSVLRAQVPYAVAEATGSPLPPPPSRTLQATMIASGGAMVLGGGFLGLLAVSRQSVLNDELCPGGAAGDVCAGVNLRPRSYYLEQNRILGDQKALAVGLMAGGAVLAAAGIYLLPPPEGGPRVALIPAGSGLALTGVLP